MPDTKNPNPLRDPRDRRLTRVAAPSALVLFGVTGDLAKKKLLPAMYDLANGSLLPPAVARVGLGRRAGEGAQGAECAPGSVTRRARTPYNEDLWNQFASGLRFVQGEFDDDDAYDRLAQTLEELDRDRGTRGNHAFYLSIPPKAFETVCQQLADRDLADSENNTGWRRVVIEKPFGHDLESAREQNILALRFANQMFEPLWDARSVDHVQITMAEEIGIGSRAGYYDGVGAARDVIQNHLRQLLALTAMEEPASFSASHLRREKAKVLESVVLPEDLGEHSALGQYTSGLQGGEFVKGFHEESDIPADSRTETFAALRVDINNRRWAGVPFYLRAGKRLGRRVTEIAVAFKKSPNLLFRDTDHEEFGQNAIVIRIQPDEGVTIRFGSKVPGTQSEIRDVTMDFGYGHAFTESSPEAYERLIFDVLLGEPPLFPDHSEVEQSWKILDPFEQYWSEHRVTPEPYEPGSWGPASAHELMARDGRVWRRP